MANKYYYLVASLPRLEFGEHSPISKATFLAECEKWLSPTDLDNIKAIDINNLEITAEDNALVKEWKAFDAGFRTEIKGVREARRRSSGEKISASLKIIFNESTPLLKEKKILEKRWEFLEEGEFGYHFDINVLVLYFLKLQILERLEMFDKEKGKEVFEKLCEVTYGS